MKKKFGDLNTGDIIYYICWDAEENMYRVFEHNIIKRETIDNRCVCLDIELKPGDYYSHRFTNLCLDKNSTTKTWGHPTGRLEDNPGGLSISVDYDEAKEICLKFMIEYVDILVERSNDAQQNLYEAVKNLNGMQRDFEFYKG